jgi:hypothetical protein
MAGLIYKILKGSVDFGQSSSPKFLSKKVAVFTGKWNRL